jgi:acetyltransferase
MKKMENELLLKILNRYKLTDGTTIGIGFVGPEDEERLLSGFKKLSPQTKLYRFHCSKQELSKNEKNYLLNIDNVNHLGIGAVDLDKSYDVGIGLARYIKEKEDPTRAEAAITVIDDYQNRGIGTYLFKELLVYANKNGIRTLTSYVLKENLKMIRILDKFNYIVKEDLGDQYRIEVNAADIS